ncbi:MAG: hypothetical protein Q9188_002278 [Gyalolechia gomerana]
MPHFAVFAEPYPFLLSRKRLAFTPSCIESYQYGTKAAKTSTSISTSIQRPARKGNQEANRFLVLDPVDELTRRSLLSGKAALCDQHIAGPEGRRDVLGSSPSLFPPNISNLPSASSAFFLFVRQQFRDHARSSSHPPGPWVSSSVFWIPAFSPSDLETRRPIKQYAPQSLSDILAIQISKLICV